MKHTALSAIQLGRHQQTIREKQYLISSPSGGERLPDKNYECRKSNWKLISIESNAPNLVDINKRFEKRTKLVEMQTSSSEGQLFGWSNGTEVNKGLNGN